MTRKILFPTILLALACAYGQPKVTEADVEAWMESLSNWGRWGPDDQLGAVNLITPETRMAAAKLVEKGVSVSMARDVEKDSAVDNPRPFRHKMLNVGLNNPGQFVSDDYQVSYHGYAHTHMDSLCHMAYNGKMYNGFPQAEVVESGAPKLAVTAFKQGIFARGVLMDIPRLKGVDWLEPGTPIYPSDLDAWEKKAGFKTRSGDIVLIRSGRWAKRDAEGPWDVSKKSAGLHASAAEWLKERDAAILGSDAASDVAPSLVEGVGQPIHQLVIIAMGMPIFDNLDLEAVGEEAARQGRWEFLVTAAPMAVGGGTGSPFNPIATF